jgi:hypothetical protein
MNIAPTARRLAIAGPPSSRVRLGLALAIVRILPEMAPGYDIHDESPTHCAGRSR